jgi:hypothetical protein
VGDAEYLENAGYRGGLRMIPLEGADWRDSPNLLFMPQDHMPPQTALRGEQAEDEDDHGTFGDLLRIAGEGQQAPFPRATSSGGLKISPDSVAAAKSCHNFTGVSHDVVGKAPARCPDVRNGSKPSMAAAELHAPR